MEELIVKNKDFNITNEPWLTENKIDPLYWIKEREKLYCYATTDQNWLWYIALNQFQTNTVGMWLTTWQINIVKDWVYLIIWSWDVSLSTATIYSVRLYHNLTEVALHYYSWVYWTTRHIVWCSKVIRAKRGDYIKLYLEWQTMWTWAQATFLQVQEL